jgi:hypothetical protein
VGWEDLAEKALGYVIRRVRSPLSAEVSRFGPVDMTPMPGDAVVFITPYPRGYSAQLRLVNRMDEPIYVTRIGLTVCGTDFECSDSRPFRLEPKELKDHGVMFPIQEHESLLYGLAIHAALHNA